MKRSVLEKRVVRTGIKVSKQQGHTVSREELLNLRVQTLPNPLRLALVALGGACIAACYFSWPHEANSIRGLEAISGILLILFGLFGIRRTLSQILDSVQPLDAINLVGELVDAIANAVSDLDF